MHLVEADGAGETGETRAVVLAGWGADEAALAGELRRRGLDVRDAGTLLVLGPELTAEQLQELAHGEATLLAFGHEVDQAFYAARRVPPLDDVVALILAAMRAQERGPLDDAEAEVQGRVVALLRRLVQESDLDLALRDVEREARVVADAENAHVHRDGNRGITGFVARTRSTVAVARAADDPRYDPSVDGEGGPLLACALGDLVLTLTRPAHAEPFGEAELQRIEWTAQLLGPAITRLLLERELDERARKRHTAVRADLAQLFRGEALAQYQRGREDEAHPLEIEPKWTRYAARVIVALFAAALLFAALVHVDRYATGVGVVREGRLIAVVPARHHAALWPSMPLRFEYANEPLALDLIGTQLVAPSEARRILGADGANRWNSKEPAVRIEAALPDDRFGDGVAGRVQVRVGRERLLTMLLPWSRRG